MIARGMAKRPEDRYASAGDVAAAANDALTQRDQDKAATILQRSEAATPYRPPPPPVPQGPPIYQTPAPTPASFHAVRSAERADVEQHSCARATGTTDP